MVSNLMTDTLYRIRYDCQPHSVIRSWHHPKMLKASKETLRDNVKSLLRNRQERVGPATLMRLTGFKNGTVQRILAGETSVGLDVIDALAKALNVESWQLLMPDFTEKKPTKTVAQALLDMGIDLNRPVSDDDVAKHLPISPNRREKQ